MRRKFICVPLIVLLSGALSVPAQHLLTDSLKKIIETPRFSDTTRILAFAELGYQLCNTNPDSSFLMANQAYSRSKALHYFKGLGRSYRIIGIYFRNKGDIQRAMAYYDSALYQSERTHDLKGMASTQLAIGLVYQEQGNYAQALELDFNALKSFEKIGDLRSQAILRLNIGLVYLNQKYYEKAIDYFLKGASLSKEVNDIRLLGLAYGDLGFTYKLKKDYENALSAQLKSLQMLEKSGDQRAVTFPYNNLAEIYFLLGQPTLGIDCLRKGLALAEAGKFGDRIADLKKTFAQHFNEIHQYQEAFTYADEAQKLAFAAEHLELMRDASEQKYIAAKNLGRFKEALKSFQVFSLMKDSMQNEENKKTSLMKDFEFKEEKLKLENRNLLLESELKAIELRRTRFFLLSLVVLTIIAGGLAINYYRALTKNKKLAAQVKEQNEEIQAQAEELVQANEEILGINESLELQVRLKTNQIVDYAYQNAHRVRGPLARILGLINLINGGLIKPEELRSVLQMISSSADELDQIVKEINLKLDESQHMIE